MLAVLLAIAGLPLLGAAAAADCADCAGAEESDEVGLLQAKESIAAVSTHRQNHNNGYYKQGQHCPYKMEVCGSGCTFGPGSTCDEEEEVCYMPTSPNSSLECPQVQTRCMPGDMETNDGGCCPSKTVPVADDCLELNCENKLRYGCGGDTFVTASCRLATKVMERAEGMELNADGPITICERGSATCLQYKSSGKAPRNQTSFSVVMIGGDVVAWNGCDDDESDMEVDGEEAEEDLLEDPLGQSDYDESDDEP